MIVVSLKNCYLHKCLMNTTNFFRHTINLTLFSDPVLLADNAIDIHGIVVCALDLLYLMINKNLSFKNREIHHGNPFHNNQAIVRYLKQYSAVFSSVSFLLQLLSSSSASSSCCLCCLCLMQSIRRFAFEDCFKHRSLCD